ncbi:MAG: hypothetical protein A3I44_01795 [Candidatus Sungbacteria bacterium RIFCSPLOWO2_02_FULL_51_17]|uniref:Uncharacterized protein n=1 Tax=Candidatus Sungbacteria bacterium RIFCSPHIGHO2_02_FULL_51_29 TaxID=1802273 RepID=A0A1G2KXY3_9BACT|nr:MAG: hypothetical protein A2676_02045 [Candidatus Sungbacteria bacterium RIFCSPHIGHO2_01_FULL_51_22]OHA03321.1 MAG: hypothetical protein A3C16_01445 [Candidatus Sungbacteria bacterium RIFCSPHIGHO2_02_FULL_51_29]OHA05742.1 MAG: hypothetical protein A3B29_04015 [Candidatus Sungbacteria bacterium RIFCSPLOWO2_01_FULL_51_34]OHA10907.1 MAG: hypothetical protein A3I44_01795 [Candidatus Sungbacteria bacterium RIFCSPLOWO2_02_FULL_51_17]
MSAHTTYVDHITLNVGPGRLEEVARWLLADPNFTPTDYFFPLDEATGMISLVIGNPLLRIFFAVNEGLDGWTEESAARILEFRTLLQILFLHDPTIHIPTATLQTEGLTKILSVVSRSEDGATTERLIELSPRHKDPSHITTFVQKFGEGIQHVAIETDRIIPRDEFLAEHLPNDTALRSTAEILYRRIATEKLLPLESPEVYQGIAGRRQEDMQEVFQFFTRALCNGFFFEFINRQAQDGVIPRQGLFIRGTVMKLYQDKERERKEPRP